MPVIPEKQKDTQRAGGRDVEQMRGESERKGDEGERRERRPREGGRDAKETSTPTVWKEMCTIVVSHSFFDSLSCPLPVNRPAASF